MESLEEVPATENIEGEVEEKLEVFVRAYVSEFEKKLEEYAKEADVGGTAKSGEIANQVVGPVVGAIGAATGGLISGGAGASMGKGVGEKFIANSSKYFSRRNHRKKAKKITQIFQTVKTDELKKMYVEAASLIYYSFQEQFESVTDADGNWKRALRKLAIDARNRSISYLYNEETTVAIKPLCTDLLAKAVILGESKDSFMSHVTPKKIQQIVPGTKPGHTVKNESKEWKTSDIYEKVDIKIVGSNGKTKYYKKEMCGIDYGYRWAFSWENDSSYISNYTEEDFRNVAEDPRTSLKVEELEHKMDQILTNINKEDPKLQFDRIEDGVDGVKETLVTMAALQLEVIESIEPIKQDLHVIKTKFSSALPKRDQPKIFTVKEPVKAFTGRERELSQLHDKLQPQLNQVVVSQCASISGLGGMGKSELARKYAHTYHESYQNCIWIDAETRSSITQSFHRLAEKLQIPITQMSSGSGNLGERNILLIVEEIYKRFSNSKSLFIFDNVNQYEDIEDFLPSNLSPTDEKPTIVITSRNSDGDEGDISLILLDQFTPEEALSFVKKVLDIKDEDKSDDTSISELTKELCCFPLALRQAASYIKAKKISDSAIENYLVEFGDERKKRDLLKYKTRRDRYTETTYTTWQITFRNIEKNEANGPLAIRLVEVMAYLAPDIIFLVPFLKFAENEENLNEAVMRLWLEEEKREEDVLRTALTQIHDNVPEHHRAALWSFACDYTTLIKIYKETKSSDKLVFALNYLVGDGDARTTRKILNYLERRNDWREITYDILNLCLVQYNHNDVSIENTGYETFIKALVLFHAEVFNALKRSNTKDLELFLQSFDKSLINSWFGGRTALEMSTHSGKLNVVKILVENGADVNSQGWFSITAFQVALSENHPKLVEYLLDHGAEPTTDLIEWTGLGGTGLEWTVLEWASCHGYLNIVKHLLQNSIEDPWMPLYLAVQNDHVEVVEFLINHEVYRSDMKDVGQTLCRIAAEHSSIQVVRHLVDKQIANVNGRDCNNETLLAIAVNNNHFDIVKYLLSDETPDKVNIDACDIFGRTPLFQAVLRNHIEITRFLIEHGAAVDNVQNRNTLLGQLNISALHLAATYDCLEIVTLLIEECKGDINMGLNTTFSPLQVAKCFDSEEVCEFLIRKGADTLEWCQDSLENITYIFRSFCEENEKTDIDQMFSKCYLVLHCLINNNQMYRNYSKN